MSALPDPGLPWPIPLDAVAVAAEAEGLRLKAYRCPAGVWTIGRGRTTNVKPGDTCTVKQADRWFCDELTERAGDVKAACTQAPSDNELGAMTSLAYNIGPDGFKASTVLKCHNRGDWQSASRAFGLWNMARVNGVLTELPGLTARRAAEAALYLKPDGDEAQHVMPQAVEAESSLSASPISRGGIAAAGTGVVGAVASASESLGGLREPIAHARDLLVNTLGIPAAWVPWLVLIGVGVAVVWWRGQQRAKGWA